MLSLMQIHNVKEHFRSFKAKTLVDVENKTFNCPARVLTTSRPRHRQISWMGKNGSYHHRVIKSLAAWKLVWDAKDTVLFNFSISLSHGLNLI